MSRLETTEAVSPKQKCRLMLGNRIFMIYYKVMPETDNHNDLALIGDITFLRSN